jgi:hypothetical protein
MIDAVMSAATKNPELAAHVIDSQRRILEAKSHLGFLDCARS